MNHDAPFATIRNDTGIAAGLLHVSPIFVSCGPRTRGRFDDQRLARTQRTDARHARRVAAFLAAAEGAILPPEMPSTGCAGNIGNVDSAALTPRSRSTEVQDERAGKPRRRPPA